MIASGDSSRRPAASDMSDYHLHLHPHEPTTQGPTPGEYPAGLIESYVEHAGRRGVHELGITEHLYRFTETQGVLGQFWEGARQDLATQAENMVRRDRTLSIEPYVEAVLSAKDAGLPVVLGLEVDFFPDSIDRVIEFLDPYPWDVLIGSVHWIGGWTIDTSSTVYEFEQRGIEKAWSEYFELETALAQSGAVDVLAHVDVIKKYGYRPAEEPRAEYRQVAHAAAETGTAVEVSSQGLRKPANEVYPSPVFLDEFHAAGVPITLASDGHLAEEAGWGHDQVVTAARAAGYTSRLRFEKRKRTSVPL